MNDKFNNVPKDEGVATLLQTQMKFDEYDVLYEQWIWDGIYGESIIFVEAELPHMTDEALEDFVAVSPIVKAKENITISRGKNGYIFVNFNFKVLEDMEDE